MEDCQKTAGRRRHGESSFTVTLYALGLRAPELCGFNWRSIDTERYFGVCLLRQHQSSQDTLQRPDPVRPDLVMTMDIFLPLVGVNWLCLGTLKNSFTAAFTICSVLQFTQMLEESRF